jgi:hypothetical protein
MAHDARQLRFGYFLVPDADSPLLETAQHVERLGLDYVGMQDHPYQRRYVDTWALMSMIAATTTTLRIFPDVANLPLRPPAVMAKTAATIDLLSGGRFDLGLGAGSFWDAVHAYGGPRRTGGEALAALAEAIEVIRKVWSGEGNLRLDGTYYQLSGAKSGPVPNHPIGIWLGVYGPRALELAGQVADGWVPSLQGDLSPLAEMSRRLDAAAEAGGAGAARRRRRRRGGRGGARGRGGGRGRGAGGAWGRWGGCRRFMATCAAGPPRPAGARRRPRPPAGIRPASGASSTSTGLSPAVAPMACCEDRWISGSTSWPTSPSRWGSTRSSCGPATTATWTGSPKRSSPRSVHAWPPPDPRPNLNASGGAHLGHTPETRRQKHHLS